MQQQPQSSHGVQFSVILLSVFFIGLVEGIQGVLLPLVAQEYGASYSMLGTATSVHSMLFFVALFLGGRLFALMGAKPFLLAATFVFAISAWIEALMPSFRVWEISRMLQGISAGCLLSFALTFLGLSAERIRRGDLLGIMLGLFFFGSGLGGFVGSFLSPGFGLTSISLSVAVGAVFILLLQALCITTPERLGISAIFD
ncbi:MFS transporter [Brucella sp. BE17]|uniref:MFS transporter n=1 Tax=Brucella sp. BE17 TaxID=3142977 RepID=UPI0031BB0A1D